MAEAISRRRTTATRIRGKLGERAWAAERAWLNSALADVEAGTCSVLERGFVTEVLRPHGLPVPRKQWREVTSIGVVYRDAMYGHRVVELDGRANHSSIAQRDADLDRDLVAATLGHSTVRLGWGQVYRRPCHTAMRLAELLEVAGHSCAEKLCKVSANS